MSSKIRTDRPSPGPRPGVGSAKAADAVVLPGEAAAVSVSGPGAGSAPGEARDADTVARPARFKLNERTARRICTLSTVVATIVLLVDAAVLGVVGGPDRWANWPRLHVIAVYAAAAALSVLIVAPIAGRELRRNTAGDTADRTAE